MRYKRVCMKATDDDIIELVKSRRIATATIVGAHFAMSRQAAHRRCESLVEQGRLTKQNLGRDTAFLPSAGKTEVTSDTLKARTREREDGLAVDVSSRVEIPIPATNSVAAPDENTLLVQGNSGGYKFDARWSLKDSGGNNGTRQSCVHFEFGNQPNDYAYDNTHRRDVGLQIKDGGSGIIIYDSDVHAHGVGYEGATIQINTAENGFEITVSWTDEYGEENEKIITAPLIDPRRNRDEFYKIEGENYETLYPSLSR